jgi:hypothetical protein
MANDRTLLHVEWLPDGFSHPQRLDLPTGHHLRPIREADVDIDYPAGMGSRVSARRRLAAGQDTVVSWWVVDDAVGTDLERTLGELIPAWLAETWRFRSVHYARASASPPRERQPVPRRRAAARS